MFKLIHVVYSYHLIDLCHFQRYFMMNKTDLYKLDHTRKTQRLPLMKLLPDASALLFHINYYFFMILKPKLMDFKLMLARWRS